VVFNTALTGYQEILTDPSYCRQIVTLTYPHIGNYGVNDEDVEAPGACRRPGHQGPAAARVQLPRTRDAAEYLRDEGTVAIAGIDTRRLTRVLRSTGAQNGCIVAFAPARRVTRRRWPRRWPRRAPRRRWRARPGAGRLGDQPYEWTETEWALGSGYGTLQARFRWHVVAYDFGVKRNILRMLASRGCRVTVVPAQTPAAEVLALRPDGVFLSNGPGDPEPCDYAIAGDAQLIDTGMPTFGICLGHQIMALASGARPSR
jgi:carbamoyl-phosphate synthase small subunit